MNILVINTVDFKLNGISSVIMNYYRSMDKNNMKVDFVAINEIDKSYKDDIDSNNSRVYYIPRKGNPARYIQELFKLLKNNQYDIVHIHGNSSTMAIETVIAYVTKIPVRIIHSHNTTCKHQIVHKILYPVLKATYTHGFACGEEAGKWLFRKNRFEVIKNGINLDNFKYDNKIRVTYREKINAKDKKVIVNVGNFVYQKNHEFLINTFSKLIKKNSEYLLLLIGEGDLLEQMKTLVKELEISESVIFLGKTTEVSNYLQAADIFALTSHFEGVPVVLIEAQALGLPCMVSNKVSQEANLTDLIEFLPIDDSKLWIESICDKSFDKRKEVSFKSHKDISKKGYDVSLNANEMKKKYEQYLKGY